MDPCRDRMMTIGYKRGMERERREREKREGGAERKNMQKSSNNTQGCCGMCTLSLLPRVLGPKCQRAKI